MKEKRIDTECAMQMSTEYIVWTIDLLRLFASVQSV